MQGHLPCRRAAATRRRWMFDRRRRRRPPGLPARRGPGTSRTNDRRRRCHSCCHSHRMECSWCPIFSPNDPSIGHVCVVTTVLSSNTITVAGLEKLFQWWWWGGGLTRFWGPRGKGSPSVSKGPKPPIQPLQLLKNSPREEKRAHFRHTLGPPGSHPGNGINGVRRGRSLPPPPPPGYCRYLLNANGHI